VIQKWRAIDKKWQSKWVSDKAYKAFNPGEPGFTPNKKPFYVLDMFPYPSGSGLHVGHASGYIGTDVVARKKHMEGYNVLHPMGWDAFGLPAEQYAIQTGQHPRVTTDKNTSNFRRQLQNLGLSYDWDREIDTSDPRYYRWTQWIFLKLYKQGLVYRKEMPVWWCEELKTVLANEEVINGRSERGNYPCERRPLTQWVFKITEYAERLLEDLEELDWPESVKKMQRDWIGKSHGARIQFQLNCSNSSIEVFSTRPDTLFGVVALVLAPEHKIVDSITQSAQKEAVTEYRNQTNQRSERDRKAEVNQVTACFTGAKAMHPLTGEELPVYIADYVLADYGTGAVMAVPAHDERDYLLSKAVGLPVKKVICPQKEEESSSDCYTEDGVLVNSAEFSGLTSEVARRKIVEKLESLGRGKSQVHYKIRDWIFSRQRYWGEPFPLLLDEQDQVVLVEELDLPVLLPDMKDFEPSPDGSSPLARVKDWVYVEDKSGRKLRRVTDTMPGWAGSCWYYLRFMDAHNDKAPFSKESVGYWNQVDLYVGGASHAVMHLLYARFWHKVLYDIGLVPTKEPFKKLFNQGMVTAFAFKDETGRLVPSYEVRSDANGTGWVRVSNGQKVERFISKMAKSLGNVVNPDDVIESKGCDTVRLYQMFMGPLADDKPWDDVGLAGCENFLKRFWNYIFDESGQIQLGNKEDAKNWKALHKALKRVNDSFEHFNFNTAVAAFMECLNDLKETGVSLTQNQIEMLVKMMHPFAPHLTSEIWESLGHTTWLHHQSWPTLNESYLVETEFELVFQVNGKIRKRKLVPVTISEKEVLDLAQVELKEHLEGKTILKQIYVPQKLCNIVI
jgi:leucyl-tRNA synthetase